MIDANTLLHQIKDTGKYIGLHINLDKKEYMYLNQKNQINMKRLSGHDIKRVEYYITQIFR